MGKYKNANILQNEIDSINEQQALKAKHNVQADNVVVVEKTQLFKWIAILIKTVFSILVFICAAIGIFTLLYPQLRNSFIAILNQIIKSIGG
ncbi:MAG: hypothetical protein NC548_33680 [Lachnospiraceae bacterium]|nr:hypothetical protein [Lachnospiraceae bacterium]